MSKRKKPSCPSCGVPWDEHPGIGPTCAELMELRQSIAAVRADLAGKVARCCGTMAGKQPCDCYGCKTLLEIAEMLGPERL